MTPTHPAGGSPPLWQRILFGVVGIAFAIYLIFFIAIPGYKARQAALDGSSPQPRTAEGRPVGSFT